MIKELKYNIADLSLLNLFIKNAGASLERFRYFNNRSAEVIDTHVITILIMDHEVPTAYGHLDPEKDIIWLGICVAESAVGKGFGYQVMKYLVDKADSMNINAVFLKVDEGNTRAISLYKKFHFQVIDHVTGKHYIMKRIVKNDGL